jgi:hypothetical protein
MLVGTFDDADLFEVAVAWACFEPELHGL